MIDNSASYGEFFLKRYVIYELVKSYKLKFSIYYFSFYYHVSINFPPVWYHY